MSNNKQSSVDYYAKQLQILADEVFEIGLTIDEFRVKKYELLEQAKAIHKEEIVKAWSNGYDEDDRATSSPLKYYNETFEVNNEQQ